MVEAAERRRTLADQTARGRAVSDCRGGGDAEFAVEFARLETSATDVRMSTLDRCARVLGYRVQYHLIPEGQAKADPPVVVHHAS